MAKAGQRVRTTRKLRQWTVEQVESGKFPGLQWDDPPDNTMFRIPWKHAGKQEFRQEEDAGFFKAWAMFKGKCDKFNPAMWKTRIRCALSKSPEFEEMPQRSRLGIAEPYKVYRLVPASEQQVKTKPKAQPIKKPKVEHPARAGGSVSSSITNPSIFLCTAEAGRSSASVAMAACSLSPLAASACPGGKSSPQPNEPAPAMNATAPPLVAEMTLATDPAEMGIGDFSIRLSVSYSGVLMQNIWIPEGDCLITSVAALPGMPTNRMRRVVLPQPDLVEDPPKKQATLQLLKDLEKGVMAASNQEGMFIQCRVGKGKSSIYCQKPGTSQPPERLKCDDFLHVFNTRTFQSALNRYRQGLMPQPEHQVTLYFGEDQGENDSLDNKLIVIQMEQIFALRLLNSFTASA